MDFWGAVFQLLWLVILFGVIAIGLIVGMAYLTYYERKVVGYIQVRVGPNKVGFKGLLQPFADALKLMFKEIVLPANANRVLFLFAPVIALATAIAPWFVVPVSPQAVVISFDLSLLLVLVLTAAGVYSVILAGWASNSKYALLGALRSSAQKLSYELPMGFAIVAIGLAAGSISLIQIGEAQSGSVLDWFFIPLLPVAVIYFISGVAETNRAPFDVAEGESEIVAGFHVEYSGLAFGMFFIGEYVNMILISVLTAICFFGAWYDPFGFIDANVLPMWTGIFWMAVKVFLLLFLFLWFRATYPRYRYDQIMRLGWKYFLPVTLVWVFVVALMRQYQVGPWFG